MTRSSLSPATTPLATNPGQDRVWDKLWTCELSPDRDDALLARERRSRRWRLIIEQLARWHGRVAGLRTIELGSGRGDLSTLLAELGAQVTLIDASDAALASARRRFDRLGLSAEFVSSDLLNLNQELHGRFDVALSIGVIEHFRGLDRTFALRAHHDVLRPNGTVFLSVPNAHCPSYRLWKKYLEIRGCWPYGMEIPYSRRELARRAADAGFHETTIHGIGFHQSLSDHWMRNVFHLNVDWMHYDSILDHRCGLMLLLFARRSDALPRTNWIGGAS